MIICRTRQAECLRDKASPRTTDIDHEWGDLPGQRFSADMQCKELKFISHLTDITQLSFVRYLKYIEHF